jgi:cyclophilin family peptidyl-prolyl cis-trans isomerase
MLLVGTWRRWQWPRLVVLATLLASCRGNHAGAGGADAGGGLVRASGKRDILRAEAARRVAELPKDTLSGPLPERVLAVRALARIGDDAALPLLRDALHADADEVVAWAAYGLGYACKGHEPEHIKLLAARLGTLVSMPQPASAKAAPIEPRTTLLRAIARCGTPLAEDALVPWLTHEDPRVHGAAALALGDLAKRQKSLKEATIVALVAAASDASRPGSVTALYALGSLRLDARYEDGVLAGATAALAMTTPDRIFALRALASGGGSAVPVLQTFMAVGATTLAERAEAARTLGALGDPGKAAVVAELRRMFSERAGQADPIADAAVATRYADLHAPLATVLLGVLSPPLSKSAEAVLYELAAYGRDAPGERAQRRLANVRCPAALLLARGTYNSELLVRCGVIDSPEWAFARINSLTQRPLVGERKMAWQALVRSTHVRVREAALEVIGSHGELGDAGRAALAAALGDSGTGIVATAAEVLFRHPEIAFLTSSQPSAGLAPEKVQDAGNSVGSELDPALRHALASAIARDYPADAIETRVSLLAAAKALRLTEAAAFAERLCVASNPTLRARAESALRELGAGASLAGTRRCELPAAAGPAVDLPVTAGSTSLVFRAPVGVLRIQMDADLAPLTVAHMTALAASGFFRGIVVHRVAPSFVVQFGDPQGDGFGGSGKLVPCETSPVPFAPMTAGMALAGRDTGSSQLFVALVRAPHLDGEYAAWGTASGPWAELTEGDVIEDATVDAK